MPDGWLHVFDGVDGQDRAVSLVHEDTAAAAPDGGLRRRSSTTPTARAATCWRWPDGHRYGVDHGVTLPRRAQAAHRPVGLGRRAAHRRRGRRRGRAPRPRSGGDLGRRARPRCSTEREVDALARRCARLLADRGVLPAAPRRLARDPVAAVLTRQWPPSRLGFPGMRCVALSGRSPALTVTGPAPSASARHLHRRRWCTTEPDGPARLYVCGITPYDATHIGHAATYVAFDLLNRAWRNAGHEVVYVQNVTDVDDPLLERAERGARRLGRARRA